MKEKELNQIISRYNFPSGRLLAILEDIQTAEGYLPEEVLKSLSKKIHTPLSKLYSFATFYSFFNLEPIGKHIITVCKGTACHVKGGSRLLETLERLLRVQLDEVTSDGKFMITTEDRSFTINTARCFGACSMAPVIRIDGKIYGYNTPKKLPEILKKYGWRKKNED
ncbi:MAG: NAD(P)H-dependent oxidoreductase subunit E [Caldisericota bacterium]|nr:NAD(P)H-dependent oxidoreductase subunit E [Caldisericota bacterium]